MIKKIIIELENELDNPKEYSKRKILLNKLYNDNPNILIEIREKSERYNKFSKFKHGDILIKKTKEIILIFDENNDLYDDFSSYLYIDINTKKINYNKIGGWNYKDFQFATDNEKQILFDQLLKEDWKWNIKTCKIENLKWIPKKNEEYYYVGINVIECTFVPVSTHNTNLKFDNEMFERSKIFKTKESCQKFCNRLNDAISHVKKK